MTDFRNWGGAEVTLADGLTAVIGGNGQGKSSLIEALGYLATLDSFRGATTDAMIRAGALAAIVRAEVTRTDGRAVLIEAELARGRSRVQVNRQPLRRSRDLLGSLRVTVFSPDDLELVKGGPQHRRRVLDEALVSLSLRHDATRLEVDRVLKQRNALLKQAHGKLTSEIAATLDVWDAKLATCGETLAAARRSLVDDLAPVVAQAYADIADRPAPVDLAYQSTWPIGALADALAAGRHDDVRRGSTQVGPHRDDLEVRVNGLPARTHASQGEQRCVALALRLAVHRTVTDQTGETPVLLLDDVFSELDPDRSQALLAHLPPGQAVLTTAGVLPPGVSPERTLRVVEGALA